MAKFEYYLLQNNHDALFAKLKQIDPTERHLVKVKPYTEQRTDLQNRLSHGWYGELAEGIKEHDAIGYKCFCKLHFGVPIMRAEDDEFREVYDSAIKGLSYEKKIEIMKILPVTSLMNTKQLSQYLESVKEYFQTNYGFELKFPNDY